MAWEKQKAQAAALAGNQSGASNADYQGILQQAAGSVNDPYYSTWTADLDAGKLAGSPLWEFSKYKQAKSGEDAIAKQSAIEKQLAAGMYGQQQQNMQAGFAGSGIGKSGFAGQEFANLAAQENLAFSDIYNRMMNQQQSYRQGLEGQWQDDRMLRKQDSAAKKNRTRQIISTGLGVAGMAVNPLFGAGAVALNQA